MLLLLQSSDDGDGGFGAAVKKGATGASASSSGGSSMFRARSGPLPGVVRSGGNNYSTQNGNGGKRSNFDAILNSFEESGDDEQDKVEEERARGSSGGGGGGGITARMREIDSKLEAMERTDTGGSLRQLRRQHEEAEEEEEENSLASENIDAMEFSTGGDEIDEDFEDQGESSGEGSFSFLDSSSKK